ncbi:putative MFS-type transporter YhcA [Alicyclobacillus acidoterrestris]|uniref:DHA2 family efflux MFS transporter permease subunit n=1 Tax=Alicyclobacillus suci TaxID=2816080 RepID=UPI001196AB92|nr:DHA2 family efflux MFS transporter permease subunit [Alicyclobacillus suci]GEO25009.1 putative MFS-type transporter YhcA [Alicyclobacillus acidoterrestris]
MQNQRAPHLNRTLIMVVMISGAFVSILNETLLNVALPSIMRELHISTTTAQWLTTGYMLTNGVLIPASAFLIQRFSTRTLFLTAMGLFSAGTLIAAVSPDLAFLLVGRVVQASGAAIMLPLLMTTVLAMYEPHERGGAMGIMGLVITFAPAIGPTLSGWLVEHHSWRILFFVVLPVAILDLLFAALYLRNFTETRKTSISVPSLILSTLGFGGILYGFSTAGNVGWSNERVYISLAIGILSLAAFTIQQLRMQEPMLEVRVFRYSIFSLTTAINVMVMMAMFSSMLLFPLYLQNVHGFTSLQSGLLVLPGAAIMGILSPITGKLFDKIGARPLAIVGSVLTLGSMYRFSRLTATTHYSTLIATFAIMMAGMSLLMMPVMTAGLNQLPSRLHAHGTAMGNTLQQVAGAIGTALLVTVMTQGTKSQYQSLTSSTAHPLTTPSAMAQAYKEATVHGIDQAFLVSCIFAVLALIGSFFIRRLIQKTETQASSKRLRTVKDA